MGRISDQIRHLPREKEALTRKYRNLMDSESDAGRIASLQKEFEEALSALDVEKLKQEINWELIFGDLSKVSKKSLTKSGHS